MVKNPWKNPPDFHQAGSSEDALAISAASVWEHVDSWLQLDRNGMAGEKPRLTRPGKRSHNDGKSPFFNGKTHYFYGNFQ